MRFRSPEHLRLWVIDGCLILSNSGCVGQCSSTTNERAEMKSWEAASVGVRYSVILCLDTIRLRCSIRAGHKYAVVL